MIRPYHAQIHRDMDGDHDAHDDDADDVHRAVVWNDLRKEHLRISQNHHHVCWVMLMMSEHSLAKLESKECS